MFYCKVRIHTLTYNIKYIHIEIKFSQEFYDQKEMILKDKQAKMKSLYE